MQIIRLLKTFKETRHMIGKKIRRNLKKTFSLLIGKKQKNVIHIPIQLRFGNLLYFYLHCYIMKQRGKEVYILHTTTMDYWLKYFPLLNDFVVYSEDFKIYDNLDYFTSYYQNFGEDFTLNELNDFIKKYIVREEFFSNSKSEERTVVNIRRGDFYSTDTVSPSQFDQVEYVKKVFGKNLSLTALPIFVISDDIVLCRQELSFIERFNQLHFLPNNGPIDDFIAICNAKNLIVTNSTFSYWGGYVSKFLNKNNKVIAPDFGATFYKNNLAIQLHPSWVIEKVI